MKQLTFLLICVCGLFACEKAPEVPAPPEIDVWYGKHQAWGKPGFAQRWVNVLGTFRSPHGIAQAQFQLNEQRPMALSWGPTPTRLAHVGDFNVEMDTSWLEAGINLLQITVGDTLGQKTTDTVYLEVEKGHTWPLPYRVNWQEVQDLREAVQVVDGHWSLEAGGLRTLDPHYDRVIAIGDSSWTDYEVRTSVVFHDFVPPKSGRNETNVSHAAIAVRWPGHDLDHHQPHTKWYPLGATAEFRLTTFLDSCRWRIFDGENFYSEDARYFRKVAWEKRYSLKHRVETLDEGQTRYRVKWWEADRPEPEAWDHEAIEGSGNIMRGGALLIAHFTDATFGDIEVVPLPE